MDRFWCPSAVWTWQSFFRLGLAWRPLLPKVWPLSVARFSPEKLKRKNHVKDSVNWKEDGLNNVTNLVGPQQFSLLYLLGVFHGIDGGRIVKGRQSHASYLLRLSYSTLQNLLGCCLNGRRHGRWWRCSNRWGKMRILLDGRHVGDGGFAFGRRHD